MKKVVILFIGLLMLYCSNPGTAGSKVSNTRSDAYNSKDGNSLTIFAAPGLYSYATSWAGEYGKLHPEMNMEVIRVDDPHQASLKDRGENLSFVSDPDPCLAGTDTWKIAIGREVIVPVISAKNPFLDKINRKGITRDELAGVVTKPGKHSWGALLGNKENAAAHIYILNDEPVLSQVALFLDTSPGSMVMTGVANSKELLSALEKDANGIGFCRITDVADPVNQAIMPGIRLLPIDKNGNGRLDYFENIYGDLNAFVHGVWIGKYPRSLCRTIYSIAPVKPSKESELAFLTWIITGGQKFLLPGNQDLAFGVREAENVTLLTSSQAAGMSEGSGLFTGKLNILSILSLILIALVPFLLAFMAGDAFIRTKRQKKVLMNSLPVPVSLFDENSVEAPKGLYFDKTHMWAFMEKDGLVRIGIDDFLQHITGMLTGIKMKEPGERVQKGDKLLSIIRHGKQLNLLAPVSGIIKTTNASLLKNTSVLNVSPYSDGWVYLIEPTKWASEIRYLNMAEKYREWIKMEFARLKDFVAGSERIKGTEFATIILQDGGEIKDGLLAELGPTEWEDFQINFMDRSK